MPTPADLLAQREIDAQAILTAAVNRIQNECGLILKQKVTLNVIAENYVVSQAMFYMEPVPGWEPEPMIDMPAHSNGKK